VFQGPKRSKDLAIKKNKEKFVAFKTVVGIQRPQDDF
jgi:hypothetical protein